MWHPAASLPLHAAARRELERIAASRSAPRRAVLRAAIVLAASEGLANRAIARRLGVSRPTVLAWRRRFAAGGVAVLLRDAPRPGRPRRIDPARLEAILRATRLTVPHAASHWSVRGMAAAHGVSPATVQRLWKAHGLKPHLVEAFEPDPTPVPL